MSLAEVQSRIASIQSQLAALSPRAATGVALGQTTATPTSSSSAASSASFADAMAAATGATTTGTAGTAGGTGAGSTAGTGSTTGTGGSTGTGTTASGVDGDDIAAYGQRYVGVPYIAGGRGPSGWDCAGFTQWVYKQYGVKIPQVSWEQVKEGTKVPSLSAAKPGDLLFFHMPGGHRNDPSGRGINHVAIYIGDGKMVEAANPRRDTRVHAVDTAHLVEVRRVVPAGDGVARTPAQVASGGATAPATATAPTSGTSPATTTTSGRALTGPQLNAVLRKAGFSGDALRTAWAVAMRESNGIPDITGRRNPNGSYDHGLFQINDVHRGGWVDFDRIDDADYNASVAYRMSKGGTDFSAWGLGTSGWAGHLAQTQPSTYAALQKAFAKWYDAYPAAVGS